MKTSKELRQEIIQLELELKEAEQRERAQCKTVVVIPEDGLVEVHFGKDVFVAYPGMLKRYPMGRTLDGKVKTYLRMLNLCEVGQ